MTCHSNAALITGIRMNPPPVRCILGNDVYTAAERTKQNENGKYTKEKIRLGIREQVTVRDCPMSIQGFRCIPMINYRGIEEASPETHRVTPTNALTSLRRREGERRVIPVTLMRHRENLQIKGGVTVLGRVKSGFVAS